MAIDMNSLFEGALAASSQGMQDMLKQGGNSGLGYLENPGMAPVLANQTDLSTHFPESTMQDIKRVNIFDSGAAAIENALESPIIHDYGPAVLFFLALVGFSVVIFGGAKS